MLTESVAPTTRAHDRARVDGSRRRPSPRWGDRLAGFVMAAPAVIVFIAMFIVPMILAFVLSLTDWNGYSLRFDFIGFDNFRFAFRNPGLLGAVGVGPVPFLTDPAFAKATVILTIVWAHFGFNMILYIAGIKSVPTEYYEAATMDGASRWQQFRSITVPMIAPVVTVNLVLTLVGLLKAYDVILALTDGGPAASTQTIVYQILKDSFAQSRLGLGAAQSVVLLIVTAAIGLAVTFARRGAERKVTD